MRRSRLCAWGGAGRVLSDGVARATKWLSDKLSPAVLDAYEKARAAGIPVHFSQLVASKAAKTLASAASYLPFSGAGKAARKQQEAFMKTMMGGMPGWPTGSSGPEPEEGEKAEGRGGQGELDAIKKQLAELQAKLSKL